MMGRNARAIAAREAERAEFSRRLRLHMNRVGWTNAEMARQATAHLLTPALGKRRRIIGRDSVGSWVEGNTMPGPDYLAAAAAALGIERAELVPEKDEDPTKRRFPSMAMNSEGKGYAWLRINRRVTMDTALKIISMIDSEDESSG